MLREEDHIRIARALNQFYWRSGETRVADWVGGGKEIGLVVAPHHPAAMFYVRFHDWLAGMPWHLQCARIAQFCGPTKDAAVLMGLAWLTFDGWLAFMQKHKHAPTDIPRYIQAHFDNDDLTEIPYE